MAIIRKDRPVIVALRQLRCNSSSSSLLIYRYGVVTCPTSDCHHRSFFDGAGLFRYLILASYNSAVPEISEKSQNPDWESSHHPSQNPVWLGFILWEPSLGLIPWDPRLPWIPDSRLGFPLLIPDSKIPIIPEK